MLPPNLPPTPQRDGRNNYPIKLKCNRCGSNPHDVRNRIQRPNLMKMHLIRLHPMGSPLSPSQPSKGVESPLPHRIGQPSSLNQPPNLSPSPRMPTNLSVPMPCVVMPVAVPMPGLSIREVLGVELAGDPDGRLGGCDLVSRRLFDCYREGWVYGGDSRVDCFEVGSGGQEGA